MNQQESSGLRFNEGKARYDLLPKFAISQMAAVMTYGANKYAPRNWEKGMSWSKVTSSLSRHLAAIELGEDYDKETGLLHAAHVMTNAAFLTEYYKIAPQYDDRALGFLKGRKIGLDIDGVLADFVKAINLAAGTQSHVPLHWNDPIIRDTFEKVKPKYEFWRNIPVLTAAKDIPFEPHCYITTRSVDPMITQEWLDKHQFPRATLYTLGSGVSKVEVAKKADIDVFVDDNFDNFRELNAAGVFCYLFDAPHNQHYNVGHRRIKSLNELRL